MNHEKTWCEFQNIVLVYPHKMYAHYFMHCCTAHNGNVINMDLFSKAMKQVHFKIRTYAHLLSTGMRGDSKIIPTIGRLAKHKLFEFSDFFCDYSLHVDHKNYNSMCTMKSVFPYRHSLYISYFCKYLNSLRPNLKFHYAFFQDFTVMVPEYALTKFWKKNQWIVRL